MMQSKLYEGKNVWTLATGIQRIEIDQEKIKDNHQFCPKVYYTGDSEIDVGLQSSTTAANKAMMLLTDEQPKPLDELKDILKEINQVEK